MAVMANMDCHSILFRQLPDSPPMKNMVFFNGVIEALPASTQFTLSHSDFLLLFDAVHLSFDAEIQQIFFLYPGKAEVLLPPFHQDSAMDILI